MAEFQFELTKSGVREINAAFEAGALTSAKLVQLYLKRIEAFDTAGPLLNAVLHLNTKALDTAERLDAERAESGSRSVLHGMPVLVKDVFDTEEMPTTGGYLPLKGVVPGRDSTIIRRLREAGAVILAKTNLSDWFALPDELASSTLGGSTRNPYALDRTPGWSSAGTGAGVAACFGVVGLGSETGFSVRTPSSDSNLYGLAPTPGLISRAGQMCHLLNGERAGPMARCVYDLAATLEIVAGFDSEDLLTAQSLGNMPRIPYQSFVRPDGLRGARLGVLKEGWEFEPVDPNVVSLAQSAIALCSDNGASVFNPVELGIDLHNYLDSKVFRFERIHAINQYILHQGRDYPFKDAKQLLLGQPSIPVSEEDERTILAPVDLDRDPEYRASLVSRTKLREAVINLMDRYGLDALIYPHKLHGPLPIGSRRDPERFYEPNQMSPVAGMPAIICPMGLTSDNHPVGLEILGRPWTEGRLIEIASGFETATSQRQLPVNTPALAGEGFTF